MSIEDELNNLLGSFDASEFKEPKTPEEPTEAYEQVAYDPFDLSSTLKMSFEEYKTFRAMRADMVAARARLLTQIEIMDKRIEIALSTIKTLRTPV